MAISRRLFNLSLAGVATAWGSTSGFVKHTVLRRPYRHVHDVAPAKRMLLDAVRIQAECSAPLRITVSQEEMSECILQATAIPRSGEPFMLLGVHGYHASRKTLITIESRAPMKISWVEVSLMHPPFRRQDGMIHYLNPAFESHADYPGFGFIYRPHHKKLYGPGKDLGY